MMASALKKLNEVPLSSVPATAAPESTQDLDKMLEQIFGSIMSQDNIFSKVNLLR